MYLTGNKQSSKLEAAYSSLGEELQRRCVCPSCHLDNLDSFSELLANLKKLHCVSSQLLDQTFKMLISAHCNDTEVLNFAHIVWFKFE